MKLAFDSNVYEARKNGPDREYVKSDCADTCTYPHLFVHALVGFKPTTFVYLLVLLMYQRMQFPRLGIPKDADWIRISDEFGQ